MWASISHLLRCRSEVSRADADHIQNLEAERCSLSAPDQRLSWPADSFRVVVAAGVFVIFCPGGARGEGGGIRAPFTGPPAVLPSELFVTLET